MNKLAAPFIGLLFFANTLATFAQSANGNGNEIVFLAGTIQPILLEGGNFEVDFYTPKMVFNYSHGFSLDMTSGQGTTIGDVKDQELAIHIPYSTGFGIGYRLNKYFDVRIEPKMHKFEVYYDGTDKDLQENKITDYNTVTLGLGTYFRWKPFEKKDNFLKGIFTSTSLRYWPKIYTGLDGGEYNYQNTVTGQDEIHKATNIGMANTPFIFNLAIGYAIQL